MTVTSAPESEQLDDLQLYRVKDAMRLLAISGFFLVSGFLQYDTRKELHITSTSQQKRPDGL